MFSNLGSLLQKGEHSATVNINVNYLRPGKVRKFIGYAKVDKKGKKICYLSGRLE